jgi:hypothetical protein
MPQRTVARRRTVLAPAGIPTVLDCLRVVRHDFGMLIGLPHVLNAQQKPEVSPARCWSYRKPSKIPGTIKRASSRHASPLGSIATALRFDRAAHNLKADLVGNGLVSPRKVIFGHCREVSVLAPVLSTVPTVAAVHTNLLQIAPASQIADSYIAAVQAVHQLQSVCSTARESA